MNIFRYVRKNSEEISCEFWKNFGKTRNILKNNLKVSKI